MNTYLGDDNMNIVRFCYSCGYIRGYRPDNQHEKNCPVCNAEMVDTRLDAFAFGHMSDAEVDEYRKVLLGDKVIPHELEVKRVEYIWNRRARIKQEHANMRRETGEQSQTIQCPYCNSTNTTKIGTTSRMFSTLMLGLGGKVGKQWHCRDCNSDF